MTTPPYSRWVHGTVNERKQAESDNGYWQNIHNKPEDHPDNPHPGKYHYKYDCQNCNSQGANMNLEDANEVGLTIFTTRDDKSTRHISLNGRETLCGLMPYEGVVSSLPMNCEECRIQAGQKRSEQRAEENEPSIKPLTGFDLAMVKRYSGDDQCEECGWEKKNCICRGAA